MWFSFVIFLLSSIGLTFILVFFYIFKWLRDFMEKINPKFLGKLLSCPACMGFWSGLIIKYIQIITYHYTLDLSIILYGFISSFVCYLTYLLLKPLMDKYD